MSSPRLRDLLEAHLDRRRSLNQSSLTVRNARYNLLAFQFAGDFFLSLLHRLRKENPDKIFVALTEQAICPDMKWITLESVVRSLETLEPRIVVPEASRQRAEKAVLRMTSGDV